MNLRLRHSVCTGIVFTLLSSSFCVAQTLQGAGSNFPYPLYKRWFERYRKLHPTVKINYDPDGSNTSLQRLAAGSIDFAVVNAPLTPDQLHAIEGKRSSPILQIPTLAGAIVPIYKVDDVNTDLKFTGEALAGIYLGTITRWNDPLLTAANPGVPLPDEKIVVVHRSDSNDTTYVWTRYLSQVSPAWKNGPGTGMNVKWPTGLGVQGEDGVQDLVIGPTGNVGIVDLVSNIPNSIGYLQMHYALLNNLPYGDVQNSSGEFVRATESTVMAGASNNVPGFEGLDAVSLSRTAYPLSLFTWLVVPSQIKDKAKSQAIADLLRWMLTDGQQTIDAQRYARLPKNVIDKALAEIAQIR